jgi:K+-transporting ATPase ATPase C chain
MTSFIASIRIVIATMLVCGIGYSVAILGVAQFVPETARGSLITAPDGKIIGSRLIAQNFTQARYVWPRPSAAGKDGYDATSAAGSNKSPTSEDVAKRGADIVARYGASAAKPLPPELAAASGGGLDPHISERAALYQAERVAKARGVPPSQVEAVIRQHSIAPGGLLTPDRLVNVLQLNLALDAIAAGAK